MLVIIETKLALAFDITFENPRILNHWHKSMTQTADVLDWMPCRLFKNT